MKAPLRILLGAGVASLIASAEAASLRPFVTVEAPVIRLGDLFEDAGPHADTAITQAPAPGRRSAFDANWLYQVARAYQLDWRPQSRFDRAVVERLGRTISAAEIGARVQEALAGAGAPAKAQIELGQRQDLTVPLDTPPDIDVRHVTYDRLSGRFSAVLAIGGSHPAAVQVPIAGRAHATISVPTLRRALGPGDVVRKEDIELARLREDRVRPDVILSPERLIGMSPRQRLRPGEPVRDGDVRPQVLVERNATVTVMLQKGSMTLTVQGRALEDGAKGDTIRVTNLQSKKTIEALVSGPDFLTVDLGLRAIN